jgi:nucleoside-diphosphate-sugar epimerase
VGEAYRLAATGAASGAFNIAADPVLDPEQLSHTLGARRVPVSPAVLRAGASLTFLAHLQPTEPGWLDMALGVPLMDTTRAGEELGWTPSHTSEDALLELMEGMREGAGIDTPPLAPSTSGRLRVRELLTGVGHRSV